MADWVLTLVDFFYLTQNAHQQEQELFLPKKLYLLLLLLSILVLLSVFA